MKDDTIYGKVEMILFLVVLETILLMVELEVILLNYSKIDNVNNIGINANLKDNSKKHIVHNLSSIDTILLQIQ